MRITRQWLHYAENQPEQRTGAAMVEFAVVLPLFLLLIFGCFEVGRAVMVKHILEEASRAGCRVATIQYASEADVLNVVDKALNKASISGYTVKIEPNPPSSANHLETVSVEISVPHSEVAWMPSPRFMGGTKLAGVCIMPAIRDAGDDADDTPTPPGKKAKKDDAKKNKKNKKNKKD